MISSEAGVTGRSVVVTGGAGGLGRAASAALAAAGARVCVVDTDQDAADAVVAGLHNPQQHMAAAVDLARLDAHDPLLAAVEERFGRLDALAHLAAVLRRRSSIDEVTEEDWDVQLDVNLKATFFLNRAIARRFIAAGHGGRIINFTSQAWATGGFGGSVVYAASKGGIVSLSRGLARTYAKDGITVNTVAPGAADTTMMRGGLTDEQLQDFIDTIPMGRMADPAELAGIVVFLVSDAARYITGATINVTGGQLMY